MSVTDEQIVIAYPSAGYLPSTGLPQGVWRAQGRVTGDASGGIMRVRLLFNQTGAARNGQYYSLEQFGLQNGVSTAKGYQLRTSNMLGVFAEDDTVGLRVRVQLEDPVNADVAPDIKDLGFPLRIWIGRQRTDLVAAFLEALTENVLNTVTTFYGMGYFWGPGAQNAVGGMKYPTNPGMLG